MDLDAILEWNRPAPPKRTPSGLKVKPSTLRSARRGHNPELRGALGRVIRAARKARGMKAWQLAEALSTTEASVSAWEMGHVAPTLDHLCALGDVLGVTASYLLGKAEVIIQLGRTMRAESAEIAAEEAAEREPEPPRAPRRKKRAA